MANRKAFSHVGVKGFTLIELLVVIALLAVLVAGSIIAINPKKRIDQANDSKIYNDIGQIGISLKAYYTDNSFYPVNLTELVSAGDLKSLPAAPDGATYNYTRTSGCNTAPYDNCEAVVYYTLYDPNTPGNVWCWRSALGQAQELAPAACTP